MTLEDRFRKLKGLKGSIEMEKQKEKSERTEKASRVYNTYFPIIDKVCRTFAKSLGWRYEAHRPTDCDFARFILRERGPYYSCKIIVKIIEFDVTVVGGLGVSENCWSKRVNIGKDVTAEKLADTLESFYSEAMMFN